MNNYASADISIFRKDLAVKFSASNRDLDIFLVTERMHPADVYYGYVISFTSGVKLYDVMKLYKKKKGWGSVAKELGIKPGSNQFHKLKNNTLISIDKEKMHKGGGNSNGKNKMQPDSKNNKGKKN